MQHSNSTPQNLPNINVNLCSYKDMHLNVLSTIIHYSSSLKITLLSSGGKWNNKIWYGHAMEYYTAT